jgi:hypothetical protein
MKISSAVRIRRFWLVFPALIMALIFGCRCSSSKPTPDPLAGFRFSSLNNLDSNRAITDDYKAYIKDLSLQTEDFVGATDFFENGTGQHAVRIQIGMHRKWWDWMPENGTHWEHILIYDKDNKRVKVIKYRNGGYAS